MGIRSYRVIWEPLLRGKFGDYFNKISMTWVWGKIYLRVASRKKNGQKELLGYPINSFGEIISTLSDRITSSGGTIHTSTTVEKIISNDNSVTGLRIRDTNGESSTRDYDKVVSTAPSYILPFLTDELPQDYINILNKIKTGFS